MVDIESYIHGLKATWVKRLKLSNSAISQLYKRQLNHYGGDLNFRRNISVNNIQSNISSNFLTEVIKAWIMCKYNDNIKVSKQVIWNHFDICKNNGKHFISIAGTKKAYNFLNTFMTLEIESFMISTTFLPYTIFLILTF